MSAPKKVPPSELSRGELETLLERLPAENAALEQALAGLRAEVAALKGLKGRPAIKPSGLDRGTAPRPAAEGRGRGAKARKTERLAVDEDRVIAATVPAGARFKG